MDYTAKDNNYIEKTLQTSSSPHVKVLAEMLLQKKSYEVLFEYGMRFLPLVTDTKTRNADLDLLHKYKPGIVEYFDVLSNLPSLPGALKDMATEFGIFADGETLQMDDGYLHFNPSSELKNALSKGSKR